MASQQYRIYYGNGQVSERTSLERCRREIADAKARNEPYSSIYKIQHYIGDGEWETVRGVKGRS